MAKTNKGNQPRGLLQIWEDMLEATKRLAREQHATRQVMRYWIQELAKKEAPINITVPPPVAPPAALSINEALRIYYERKKEKQSE